MFFIFYADQSYLFKNRIKKHVAFSILVRGTSVTIIGITHIYVTFVMSQCQEQAFVAEKRCGVMILLRKVLLLLTYDI